MKLFDDWFTYIVICFFIILLCAVSVNEGKKNEHCTDVLHGVMVDGKCLDIKELK